MVHGSLINESVRVCDHLFGHPMSVTLGGKLRAARRCLSWYVHSWLHGGIMEMEFVNGTRLLTKRKVASRELYWTGLHEFHDMAFVAHCLRPDELFLDVGANVGAFSVMAAKVCQARCIAFEPVTTSCDLLMRNIQLNGIGDRVEVQRCAVGGQIGQVFVSSDLGARNMVTDNRAVGQAVEQIALDSLADDGLKPKIIKIDVEGYETNVIKGAAKTLSTSSLLALLVEADGHGAQYGFDEQELHETIVSYGFTPCIYRAFERELVPAEGRRNGQSNSIYVRDVEEAQRRAREADPIKIFGVAI